MKLSPLQILALGGVAIAGFLVFGAVRAGARVRDAINPFNNMNVISEGFNELTGASDRGSSLGSDIFDFVQRLRGVPEFDPNALRTLPPTVFAPQDEQTTPVNKDRRRIFVPPTIGPPIFTSLPPIQGTLL